MPPGDCVVYKLRPYNPEQDILFGVPGEVSHSDSKVSIERVEGPMGAVQPIHVRSDVAVDTLEINGTAIPCLREDGYLKTTVQFEGEQFPVELTEWRDQHDNSFVTGENPAMENVSEITCSFFLPEEMRAAFEEQKAPTRPSGLPTPWWADAGLFVVALSYKHIAVVRDKLTCVFNGVELSEVLDHGFTFYFNLDGLARFGEDNVLTLRHERLMEGQFYAARIMNVPVRMTDSLTAADIPVQVDPRELTRPFMDAAEMARMRERIALSEEVIAMYGKIPKPRERKKKQKLEEYE
ncbi:hypothetical protein ACFL1X_14405 [Candidatus Hydrogenedentota bacterium]